MGACPWQIVAESAGFSAADYSPPFLLGGSFFGSQGLRPCNAYALRRAFALVRLKRNAWLCPCKQAKPSRPFRVTQKSSRVFLSSRACRGISMEMLSLFILEILRLRFAPLRMTKGAVLFAVLFNIKSRVRKPRFFVGAIGSALALPKGQCSRARSAPPLPQNLGLCPAIFGSPFSAPNLPHTCGSSERDECGALFNKYSQKAKPRFCLLHVTLCGKRYGKG